MMLLRAPTESEVLRFLETCATDDFSYAETGMSQRAPRDLTLHGRYNLDYNRQYLGTGPAVFELAKTAIRKWKMFDLSWVDLVPPETTLEPGRTVAVVARHLGFYSLNASRILYTVEETGEMERFGFAYGTLTSHSEIGEERFLVELDRKTAQVHYDLFAFSRPGLLAWIGYPVSRTLQKRFARESREAMVRAVAAP